MHPITRNKGKEPVIPDDVDTPANDELSLGNSPSLSLSPTKNAQESTKAKSHKKPLHHLPFNDVISGASRRARREVGRRQNQPYQALRNASVFFVGMMPPLSFVHPAFGMESTFLYAASSLN